MEAQRQNRSLSHGPISSPHQEFTGYTLGLSEPSQVPASGNCIFLTWLLGDGKDVNDVNKEDQQTENSISSLLVSLDEAPAV